MRFQKIKNSKKGITLIALVITIIVLLILAGVSISMLTGDNAILSKAGQAKEATRGSQVKEYVDLAATNNAVAEYAGENKKIRAEVIAELQEQGSLTEDEVNLLKTQDVITIGGIEIDFSVLDAGLQAGKYAAKTAKYSDGTNIATIPAGFTVSGFNSEKTISSGLVIYKGDLSGADWTTGKDASGNDIKRTYNQYVWIPCTESNYKRTEWGVEEDHGSRSSKDETTLSSVTLSDYDKGNGVTSTILNEIVSQISSEKASIKKYNGFYIGRYEVGEGNVIMQYKEPSASLKWSKAYSNAKSIDVGSASVSYLSSSYARDTALNFIQNNSEFKTYAYGSNGTDFNENWKDKSVTYIDASGASQTKAAGTATRLPTGVTTAKCNIYDMGGNVTEFTTELNPLTNGDKDATIVFHGGDYNDDSLAGYRWDGCSASAAGSEGFRATLFIQ